MMETLRERQAMSYYKECPICGAALDPGEKCECEDAFMLLDTIDGEEGNKDE